MIRDKELHQIFHYFDSERANYLLYFKARDLGLFLKATKSPNEPYLCNYGILGYHSSFLLLVYLQPITALLLLSVKSEDHGAN